jgi:Flp pilus assembly protein TadG
VVLRFRQLRGEQGNALVEFALAVSVLLTLLFGIIDIGRALYAYDWLYNGARQATRWAMVRGSSCNSLLPGCPLGANGADIQNYVTNNLPAGWGSALDTTGIDTSAVSVTSKCFAADSAGGPPPCAPTGYVQVQVTYQFHFITPFLSSFASWPMTSTSERVVQGSPTSD